MNLVHPQLFEKKNKNNNKSKVSIMKDKLFATSLQIFLKPIKLDRFLLKIFWITFLIINICKCLLCLMFT
jgi:hypothetical protein